MAYTGDGSNEPPWWPSRYGADDRIGASNELTPERVLAALKLPRTGEVIPLALPLANGVPTLAPRTWHQVILAHGATAEQIAATKTRETSFEEQVVGGYHVGCHVDGLGHMGIDGRFYNGLHYRDFVRLGGFTALGADSAGPWVARGICLDLPAAIGEQPGPGFVVTPEHLDEACEHQGVTARPGDVVLLHTGWSRHWRDDPERYAAAEPGPGWDAGHWLSDRRVSLIGADNWGLEPYPFEHEGYEYPVHQHLLAETGTNILENIDTHPLVAGGGYSEFLFVLALPNVTGATGGLANPIAVV